MKFRGHAVLLCAALCCMACDDDTTPETTRADSAGDVLLTDAETDASGDVATTDLSAPDVASDTTDTAAIPDVPDVGPDLPREVGTDASDADMSMTIAERCFPELSSDPGLVGPDYDQFSPTIGSHCFGTNHQFIFGVEQVVFLGDSVTVGTPNLAFPSPQLQNNHYYRNLLAEWLAVRFQLGTGSTADWGLWKGVSVLNGTGLQKQAGNFLNCSKWGARTDDFLAGGNQIAECFPTGGSDKRTLFVFTMGGNDLSRITEDGSPSGGKSLAEMTTATQEYVQHLEDAVKYIKDPVNFPAGAFIVFANPFEFTDGTGDTSACPVAELAGLEEWDNPDDLANLVVWAMEQYMRIAVENQIDLLFMLETFCGHGYVATGPNADTMNRCYRGPNTQRWFDETCIHPSPPGHQAIADMFQAIIDE